MICLCFEMTTIGTKDIQSLKDSFLKTKYDFTKTSTITTLLFLLTIDTIVLLRGDIGCTRSWSSCNFSIYATIPHLLNNLVMQLHRVFRWKLPKLFLTAYMGCISEGAIINVKKSFMSRLTFDYNLNCTTFIFLVEWMMVCLNH